MQELYLEELLESQTSDDECSCFSSLSVNSQGQLCLSLNRPLVFATNIEEVITLGPDYGNNSSRISPIAGDDTSTKCYQFNLIHHSTQRGSFTCTQHSGEDVMSSTSLRIGAETCATETNLEDH